MVTTVREEPKTGDGSKRIELFREQILEVDCQTEGEATNDSWGLVCLDGRVAMGATA